LRVGQEGSCPVGRRARRAELGHAARGERGCCGGCARTDLRREYGERWHRPLRAVVLADKDGAPSVSPAAGCRARGEVSGALYARLRSRRATPPSQPPSPRSAPVQSSNQGQTQLPGQSSNRGQPQLPGQSSNRGQTQLPGQSSNRGQTQLPGKRSNNVTRSSQVSARTTSLVAPGQQLEQRHSQLPGKRSNNVTRSSPVSQFEQRHSQSQVGKVEEEDRKP